MEKQLLSTLNEVPGDPILSISAKYRLDNSKNKVDLSLGVYKDENAETPIMQAVKLASQKIINEEKTKTYVGLDGNLSFNEAILKTFFEKSIVDKSFALQSLSGSGALRLIADLIFKANPNATVWLSDLSYPNHEPIMKAAGLKVKFYPYFDNNTKNIDEANMFESIKKLGNEDILLLHGCCHNPSGTELSFEQWVKLADIAKNNKFIPFIDIAYAGLSEDFKTDLKGVNHLLRQVPEAFVAVSCAKSFGLYRERVGAAIVVSENKTFLNLAHDNLLKIARTSYTMPPNYGAYIVSEILNDEKLYKIWEDELKNMANRLKQLRFTLVEALNKHGANGLFDFINNHHGLFSITGLSEQQVDVLREKYSIYMVRDSRINVAGVNNAQVDYIAQSIMDVVKNY